MQAIQNIDQIINTEDMNDLNRSIGDVIQFVDNNTTSGEGNIVGRGGKRRTKSRRIKSRRTRKYKKMLGGYIYSNDKKKKSYSNDTNVNTSISSSSRNRKSRKHTIKRR